MRRSHLRLITIIFVLCLPPFLCAQKTPSSNSSGASNATLPGLSYDYPDWHGQLTLRRIDEKNRVVVCFELKPARNSVQPFVLVPVHPVSQQLSQLASSEPFTESCKLKQPNEQDPAERKWCSKNHRQGSWSPCSVVDDEHPILMGQQLVIGVRINSDLVSIERLKLLNLNVTLTQSSPILLPVRPSASSSSQSVALGSSDFYLTWPNKLPGDQIPTVSVNTVYTPPIPGETWAPHVYYPVGSIVTPTKKNGHYYVATTSDISDSQEPFFPATSSVVVTDNEVIWVDSGLASSLTKTATPWLPDHQYNVGDSMVSSYNGHVYIAMSKGNSEPKPTDPISLPVAKGTQLAPAPTEIQDGSVVWQKAKSGSTCKPQWKANSLVHEDDLVGPYNNSCYKAANDGMSGPEPSQPFFPAGQTEVNSGTPKWADAGLLPPQAVTGALPSDQTVNMLTLQLPQVHTKSYYNLASGVVYSTVHSRTFAIPSGATDTSGQTQTSSSPTIDPVLFFTGYPWPSDTEQHCSFPRCLWQTKPGVSFGLSLVSPSNSFYGGGSFELFRNIQVVIGNNWAKQAQLPATPVKLASNATTAVTVQKFKNGAFYGLTLNVSGFIQGLFGGGGSSKSSASSFSQ